MTKELMYDSKRAAKAQDISQLLIMHLLLGVGKPVVLTL
jgi:hypothetical protein